MGHIQIANKRRNSMYYSIYRNSTNIVAYPIGEHNTEKKHTLQFRREIFIFRVQSSSFDGYVSYVFI